jgi:predicted enzyme related to lactoylglutathione lyase
MPVHFEYHVSDTDFEGIGRLAYCEDGEGNIFGIIQPPARD